MKKISSILCILVALTTIVCSCSFFETNDAVIKNPNNSGCDTCKVVRVLNNQKGFIGYNSVKDRFSIRVHVEGTIDEQEIGIITNMVEDLKEEVMNFDYSKGTIEVVFSGVFKEFNNDSIMGPVGTTFYYLQLSSLKIINKSTK